MNSATIPWKTHTVTGVTGLNLLFGVLAVMAALGGWLPLAAGCLLSCVLFDAADGWLARRWKVDSEFGEQMDSLADMTSFVMAGAVVAVIWLSGAGGGLWLAPFAGAYVLAGALRLARYNVEGIEDNLFRGMPTTAAGTMVALLCLTCPQLHPGVGAALLLVTAVLMVSPFPYPKFARLAARPALWGCLVVGVSINPVWTVWIGGAAYLVSGPLKAMVPKSSQRRSRPFCSPPRES